MVACFVFDGIKTVQALGYKERKSALPDACRSGKNHGMWHSVLPNRTFQYLDSRGITNEIAQRNHVSHHKQAERAQRSRRSWTREKTSSGVPEADTGKILWGNLLESSRYASLTLR